MPNKRNIETLENLKQDLQKYGGFLVLDCSGIDVKEMTSLRRKLEGTNAKLKIYKNRLVKIAINETKKGVGSEEFFKGPSGLLFVGDDPVKTIKSLYEFIKDREKPKVKGLFVFDRVCKKDDFQYLAQLRPLSEERAIFVGLLQKPLLKLVNTLHAIPWNFVMTVEAVKNKQS